MPCYQVRTMSVEFQAKHKDLLEQAITSLGWQFDYNSAGTKIRVVGRFTIDLETQRAEIGSSQQSELNQLKRAYSEHALDRVAKLNRWAKKSTDKNKGVLRRF